MLRPSLIIVLCVLVVLTACEAAAATPNTTPTTDLSGVGVNTPVVIATGNPELTPIVITVEAVTASVGTVEPETVLPPDQITPVTYIAPTSTPIPPLSGGLGPTELKYRVLAEFPDFFFCDPDYYPIAREDEGVLARQRFPEIQANAEEFNTILAHNNLTGITDFNDDQKLLIYREHKKLNALYFEVSGSSYKFQLQEAREEGGSGELITGLIDGQGNITVQQREQSFAACPICLAAGTLIDTPTGSIPVQDIRPGTLVWTVDDSGARIAAPVIKTGKTVVPASHQVIHVVLADGRELFVSPGHPTADGRTAGSLQVGDSLDGVEIVSAERIPYTGYATYDLLPAGATGFYWANGILMGSTLAEK